MSALTPTWLPLALAVVFAGAVPGAARGRQEPAPPAAGTAGLEPVDPEQGSLGSARAEARAEWRERLLDTDLARREQSFERLLEAVRRNPSLTGWLREWAADGQRLELAWTARLALRELGRPPGFGLHGHILPLGPVPDPARPGGSARPGPGEPGRARSFSLSEGPAGVTLRVETESGGQRETRTFEGADLAGILAAHPELEALLRAGPAVPGAARPAPGGPSAGSVERAEPWGFGAPLRTDVLGVVVRAPTPAELRRFGLSSGGLTVERVVEGTIAEALGLRAGILLLEIDGRPIEAADHIPAALAARPARGELRLTVVDAFGRRRSLTWRPAFEAAARPPAGGE